MVSLLDTEIDWSTYVQQVELFLSGVRDYSSIKGDTGPVVYPGNLKKKVILINTY